MKNKKLYRNINNKMLCGVCSGVADYFGIDPTIVRVIYAVLSLFTASFPGLILYFVLALIIPSDNGMIDTDAKDDDE